MKKIVLLIIILLLSSCGKSSHEVVFFTWTPQDEYKANQKLITDFQKLYPEIKIKHINDSSRRSMDKLQTMFVAKTAPDVMSIHGAYYIPFASKDTLIDLDEFIEKDKDFKLSKFYPELVDACRYNGKLHSLPRYTSVYVLFYNKELFDKEGLKYPDKSWTWQNYLDASKAMTRDTDNNGIIDQFGCIIDFWGARLYPWIWQNNGRMFNDRRNKSLFNQPPAVDALQFLVDLQYKHKVTPKTLPEEFKSNVEMFAQGKVGMFVSGAWEIQNLKHTKLEWDIAPMPKRKQHATILGMENYAISKQTKFPEESWLFFKYLLSESSQLYMAQMLEKQPTLVSITADYLKENTGYDRNVLVDAINYAKKPPNIPQWTEVEHLWQDQLDLIWVREKTVQQGLNSAAAKIDKKIKEN